MKLMLVIKIMLFLLLSCSFEYNNPNHRANIDYSAPEIISVSKGGHDLIELQWTAKQPDVREYIIYRGPEKNALSEIGRVSSSLNSYIDSFSGPLPKSYYYAVEAVLSAGEISSASNIEEGYTYYTEIPFVDPVLETAVKNALGKTIVYAGDAAELTYLNINRSTLVHLNGLEYLTGLETLHLYKNNISDIGPLFSLTNLKTLSLDENSISDIRPLSSLKKLETLLLYKNSISNIKPLSSLKKLKILYLDNNEITNISSLSSLTELTYLQLDYNEIKDIKPLSSLTKLTKLFLWSNEVENINPLSTITTFDQLELSYNNIKNINMLVENEGIDDGDYLTLEGNPLTDEAKNSHLLLLRGRGVNVTYY